MGMLAVVSVAPEEAAGHASGVVQFGFLMGLALGAPIFGAVVDAHRLLPARLARASPSSAWWPRLLTVLRRKRS